MAPSSVSWASMAETTISSEEHEQLRAEREQLTQLVAALRETIKGLEGKTATLESALINHADEIALLRRKLFGARSERGGTQELQLLLGEVLKDQQVLQEHLDKLRKQGDEATGDTPRDGEPQGDAAKPEQAARPSPKGRRDLSVSTLPKVVVEIKDPELDAKGVLFDYEESRQLGRRRGGFYVLVKRVAKYRLPQGESTTVLAAKPPRSVLSRGMLHTSVLAWLAVEKFGMGVPHHRLEQQLASEGVPLDRSVMCRNMEELGSLLSSTVVSAMLEHARTECQVLSTDATGAAIQPGPRGDGPKRPCKKGHFFTIVADCDHVLFEYTSEHSSSMVAQLFKGFTGLLQSDASSVYDVLERGPPELDDKGPKLVGCWAHCRRYFFDAAVCKYPVGLQGLLRIRAIYAADQALAKLPPSERARRRLGAVKTLIDDFFAWVATEARKPSGRNLATKALGYALNQEHELRRVLVDGRLPLDNTRSERALRTIVVGRKAWLFYGSDAHANAAAAIFSLIASCRLHRLDPVAYLEELLRVLPHWPRERYLDLAPFRWRATRDKLSPGELEQPLGSITIPVAAATVTT